MEKKRQFITNVIFYLIIAALVIAVDRLMAYTRQKVLNEA